MKTNLNKTTVIPKLLKMLEERRFATLNSAIQKLEERNVIWPELAVIKESARHVAKTNITPIYGLSEETTRRVKSFEKNRPGLWDQINSGN
jgi:hypothetical protein